VILLLDTRVFLWWDGDHAALRADTRVMIADAGNRVLISAGSIWEIAIKRRLGKLRFEGSPTAAITANGFEELPILPVDAERAGELTWAHADPFDRLLVAQARRLAATLVTADAAVRGYGGVPLMWAG
jgi:PIN domain nuclease of toxin-antitoxin system